MKRINMNKKIIRLTESDLHRIIKDSVCQVITETIRYKLPRLLYHKAPVAARQSIMKNGLIPSVGDSYKAHWDDREDLNPYVFLYDHNTVNNGEYDSTYDDDIYAVDVSQLDTKHIFRDPDNGMNGCFVYDIPIPTSVIKLVYKGTEGDSDERLMAKHSNIYESINGNIRFEEFNDGNTIDISVYNGGDQMGYLKIEIHDYDSLESEIFGTTDSYDIVDDVFSMLNKRRPIIELSDTTVNKEYRRMGVSKMLLEYVLNKYSDYQFFLRVSPYGGGGPNDITLANSLKKYGFEDVEVDDSDYGIFLVKK